jgi:N-acetyl-anhydromuramyl-L-alanine amidase AmpD
MKTFYKGERGEDVRDLQKMLLALGFALPRFGADGQLGDETIDAMNAFLAAYTDQDFELNAVIDEREQKWLEESYRARQQKPQLPARYENHTLLHPLPNPKHCHYRGLVKANGVTLHQTAVLYGDEAPASSYYRIPAHFVLPRDGRLLHLNGIDWNLPCANGLNPDTISVEIEGRFRGVESRPETLWRHKEVKPSELTPEQIQTARDLLRWLAAELANCGARLRYLYAHRQASNERQSDPGERIWRELALWGEAVLGLEIRRDHTRGDGLKIPKEWDPKATARY